MINQYLLAFIIGSSWPVFITYFLEVKGLDPSVKNYSYQDYTLIAPIYLGLVNMLGLYFLGADKRWLTGLLSGIFVATFATLNQSYNFSPERWMKYYIYIVTKHMFIFGFLITLIENLITKRTFQI